MTCELGLCRDTAAWVVVHPATGLDTNLCGEHVEKIVTWGVPDPIEAIHQAQVRPIVETLLRSKAA